MFYYLYEIKNLINGKIYRGVHKTKKMDDGYMGSGAAICEAIKTDGLENFVKTILETFESSEEMFAREKELVNAEFLAREDVYNKRGGGFGGFDYINRVGLNDRTGMIHTTESRSLISLNCKAAMTDDRRAKMRLRMSGDNSPMKDNDIRNKVSLALLGKSKTEAHSKNIADSIRNLHKTGRYSNSPVMKSGEGHPCYGKHWITNELENRMVSADYLLPQGWRCGRRFQKRK